ncbi:GrpB family protein, partial [Kibdelosporangium lantanae]
MLKIHVVGDTDTVASRLRDLGGLVDVTWSPRVEPAGLVVAMPGYESDDTDAVVGNVETLWERIYEVARNVADQRMVPPGAAKLVAYRPEWAVTGRRLGGKVLAALAHLPDSGEFSVEHIGSTSVPGLAAKPVVDLQLGVPDLEKLDGITEALAAFGFVDVAAHRPNSPGVLAD